ncbi:MAG: hypothetical protein LBO80_03365 [Treponema sp.]|nr:hypothetical protein [Treponema sp.]
MADRLSLLTGILGEFAIYGDFETLTPFGSGHINDTFRSRLNGRPGFTGGPMRRRPRVPDSGSLPPPPKCPTWLPVRGR